MATFSRKEKERIAKKIARSESKVEKLQDKWDRTFSERKEKRLDKKIAKEKSLQRSYKRILSSPTKTENSNHVHFHYNNSHKSFTKKK